MSSYASFSDVALITFVPFTIEILGSIHKEKHLIPVIVLQTIAANLGSMLTPIGNPQNLYLYSVSAFSFGMFIRYMLPLVTVSFFLLLVILLSGDGRRGEPDWLLQEQCWRKRTFRWIK